VSQRSNFRAKKKMAHIDHRANNAADDDDEDEDYMSEAFLAAPVTTTAQLPILPKDRRRHEIEARSVVGRTDVCVALQTKPAINPL
jgi:hypothetical protein